MAKRDTTTAPASTLAQFHPCPAHLAPTRTLLYGHILQGLLANPQTLIQDPDEHLTIVDAAVGLTNEALLRLDA